MSRTPNTRKQETHERIVDVAARAIRRHGYAGVGVADVMKQAGLTHGGFYAHFDSRDALLVEALERAGRESGEAVTRAVERRAVKGVSAFRALVEAYLADEHLASLETGCPVAALGCDMPRQSDAVREASAERVRRLVAGVQQLPHASRATASVVAGTLVGTLQLARALGDNAEGRAVLSAARKALIQQYDTPARRPANRRARHDPLQPLARSSNMTLVIFDLQPDRRLSMKIDNAVALVTGANRGIGLAFTARCSPAARARCTPARAIPRPSRSPASSRSGWT